MGTVLALSALGLANNIYTQIGILLLIALAAKNAILIVEVAREQREFHHKSIMEAAVLGAKTRFRPIIMTSFAFILGVMPLVFALALALMHDVPLVLPYAVECLPLLVLQLYLFLRFM